jgi:hypothetical protein
MHTSDSGSQHQPGAESCRSHGRCPPDLGHPCRHLCFRACCRGRCPLGGVRLALGYSPWCRRRVRGDLALNDGPWPDAMGASARPQLGGARRRPRLLVDRWPKCRQLAHSGAPSLIRAGGPAAGGCNAARAVAPAKAIQTAETSPPCPLPVAQSRKASCPARGREAGGSGWLQMRGRMPDAREFDAGLTSGSVDVFSGPGL